MSLIEPATRHPTAVIEDGAVVPDSVAVGPHAVIGPDVTLGEGVKVGANVVISGHTSVGEGTVLHPGVIVGEPPQDFSYKGEPTELAIGARCTLREHVTINIGTAKGRGRTVIGDDCYFMTGAHVGHDCIVGNHVTLSNNVLIGGHAQLEDYVLIGGATAVVQRIRIGAYVFVSGLAGVTTDVMPFGYVTGRRAWVEGLNVVGLRRRGFDRAALRTIHRIYEILLDDQNTVFSERQAKLRAELAGDPHAERVLAFIDAAPARPIMQARRHDLSEEKIDYTEAGR